MTPVVAAAARTAARRQFSLLSTLRSAARSMESHPFERLPKTQKPQAGDWGKMASRLASQSLVFFPGIGLILGWPYLAAKALDGHL